MPIQRRTLIQGVFGGAVVAGPLQGLAGRPADALFAGPPAPVLVPIPDLRDGVVRLHLPSKFKYRSFHDTEFPVVLDDGTALPGRHDGMGAFRGPDRSVILVRNHEINGPGSPMGPGPVYDTMAKGGTATIQVTRHGEVLASYNSLAGTMMNCAGGRMPWGSWLSGEETVNGPDVGADFTGVSNVPLTKTHGYLFEVPAAGVASADPITSAGRFAHESVSFDREKGVLYLTEDNFAFPSGFYRYRPPVNPVRTGYVGNGGTLEMLKVVGVDNAHLEGAHVRGARYNVEWVPIAQPDTTFPYTPGQPAPTTNDQALNFVGDQGRALGAAGFSRLEGQVIDDGIVYFTSTQGGGAVESGPESVTGYGNGSGQVWAYNTERRTLTCVFQSPGPDVLELPDNMTVSEGGTLVICEDGPGDNYVRGLTKKGRLFNIALNRLYTPAGVPRFGDEFSGATFSRGGDTLFVNIQASRGISFAIWGPWESIGV